jgi:transglutaminase 1
VEEKSHDSIWNYHVWVESWMSRPDLGSGYGGWQAVDATPQEISPHSKSYVVGPASLTAVKNGQGLSYDTDFVIAEVNADILDYVEVEMDQFELVLADTRRVGKTVSTKSVGSSERCDVTQSYKFEEGSALERAALGTEAESRARDVEVDVEFSQQATIGENFDVVVMMRNKAQDARNVSVHVIISAVTYTGGTGNTIKRGQDNVALRAEDQSGSFVLRVSASDYLDSLRDQALLSVTVLAMVAETKQSWVNKIPYRLHTPDLTFVVDGKEASDQQIELEAGGSYPVKVFFTNPMAKSLTNVMFHIEGTKLTKSQKIAGRYVYTTTALH